MVIFSGTFIVKSFEERIRDQQMYLVTVSYLVMTNVIIVEIIITCFE